MPKKKKEEITDTDENVFFISTLIRESWSIFNVQPFVFDVIMKEKGFTVNDKLSETQAKAYIKEFMDRPVNLGG